MDKSLTYKIAMVMLSILTACVGNAANTGSESTIEAVVMAASVLPPGQKSDYPDCNFTVDCKVERILSGAPVPQRMQLVVNGFRNRTNSQTFAPAAGHKIRLKVRPYDRLPPALKEIQQADDLQLYDLEQYYTDHLEQIWGFSESRGPESFKAPVKYVSPFSQVLNPPLPLAAVNERKRCMESDLKMLSRRFSELRGKEKELNAAFLHNAKQMSDRYNVSPQKMCYGVVGKCLVAAPGYGELLRPEPQTWTQTAQKVKQFSDYLASQNVQLIVVPMPFHPDVARRLLFPQFAGVLEPYTASVVKTLLEHDVEALYVMDELIAHANEYDRVYPLEGNDHPGFGASDIPAAMVAQRLKRFGLTRQIDQNRFSVVYQKNKEGALITPPLEFPDGFKATLSTTPWETLLDNKSIENRQLMSADSPILLAANSFSITPVHNAFPANLARHTGILPDFLYMSGNRISFSLASQIFLNPHRYLKGKQVMIMYLKTDVIPDNGFLDIKTLDERSRLLDGKQEVAQIRLPAPQYHGETPKYSLPDGSAANYYPLEQYAFREISFEVPASVKNGKAAVAMVEFMVNSNVVVECNGKTEWEKENYSMGWTRLPIMVTAGGNRATFRIAAPKPAMLFLNPEIRFFQ